MESMKVSTTGEWMDEQTVTSMELKLASSKVSERGWM